MSKAKEHTDADTSDEDVTFDFSKLKDFFSSKTFSILLVLLLIAIPVVLTVYIRLQPEQLVVTKSWAQNSVDNYYRNQIAQTVNAQYPNLPTTQRIQLIEEQFTQFKKTNADQINQQVTQTAAYFKSGFQYTENSNTHTFLGDLDSYYYLRFARNIKEKGSVCDEIVDGVCRDTRNLAPVGTETSSSMHPYGIFYWYSILHFFSPKINLMDAAFYLPTLLAVIAAIAAFFIGRRLMNNVAGFFAAMFVTLSPLFITRTLGSDTDVWNVMFPLLIMWICIEAFEAKELWKKATLAGVAGLFVGLFAFAWASGYWYVFDFILAAIIGYLFFEVIRSYLKHKKFTKLVSQEVIHLSVVFVVLIISAGIFVSLFTGFGVFKFVITAPLSLSSGLKAATNANLWPNVYTTVAELNEASIATIINQVAFGLNMLFSLALLGIILLMVKRKPDFKDYLLIGASAIVYLIITSNWALQLSIYLYLFLVLLPVIAALIMLLREKESVIDAKLAIILVIWFIGMIFASTKGIRFILLLTPAFGIAIGVTIGYFYQYFTRIFTESFHMKEILSKLVVFILLCLILIAPISIGISAGKSYIPSMTKGWWDSLTKIREESKPDAIINSWWDFGHWFKYVADRQVTLDGNIQNHPNAHWLGRILQTSSETEAVGILRMLDCGSNTAFEEVNKKYNDTEISQNIIAEIIMLSKIDAAKVLAKYGYTETEITTILSKTHCTPPDNYFITSEDMVGKAGVWAHFGLWDFDKAYIINNVRPESFEVGTRLLKERFNYSDEEAAKIYYEVQALSTDRQMNDWIAPWPGYAGNMVTCTESKNATDIVLCQTNLNLGSNGQANVVIERAVINLTNPLESVVSVGFFDSTNRRVGQNVATFQKIVIADKNYTTYTPQNATFTFGLLLNINHENNQTTYSAIVADQLLIDSTFTKLFFLDGKNMNHFEKFSETTDITGTKIIVWKVKWE